MVRDARIRLKRKDTAYQIPLYFKILVNTENIAKSSTNMITVSSQFSDSEKWKKENLVDGFSLVNTDPRTETEEQDCFHSEVNHFHMHDKVSELVSTNLEVGAVAIRMSTITVPQSVDECHYCG